jgi:hypothetical protein
MTYPPEDVVRALSLGDQGLTATAISRELGIPRRTVHEWLHGRVPRGRLGRRNLCTSCGHAPHEPDDLPVEYLYLLGVYLGDGCISAHPRGVYRLRLFLDARYPGIVEEVARAIRVVRPRNAVGMQGRASEWAKRPNGALTTLEVSSYSRSWPCLLPQHGPGMKHERRIELVDWQTQLVERDPRPLLRGLIHSDGCRGINTGRGGWRHPRYSFSNRSEDILGIFMRACELDGIRYTTCPHTVYVSRKADVARMDEFVGPKA